ncbi:lipoate--protein ligase family protein [Prosthecobacter fluviatilis]|uniref:Biotin/lipoate A/B protein ligase family protein n=1 Tax=Prosthecobacter fluviatilis TaxID=445931 RepID=A0ABW0KKH0_9BACT
MDIHQPLFNELILHLDAPPHDGPWNMAADQAWLELSAVPVLRVYRWTEPTATIGYAQSLTKLGDSLPQWPIVRRWTGGGVVLHDNDYTYSVIVPAVHPWSQTNPLESYRLVHDSLARALDDGSRLAGMEDLIENPFCFVAPALHDVIRDKVKVSGAGQRRGKLGLLHQGSVQQVTLGEDFWPRWAAQLAANVLTTHEMPPAMLKRANELTQKRYSLASWLNEREDAL